MQLFCALHGLISAMPHIIVFLVDETSSCAIIKGTPGGGRRVIGNNYNTEHYAIHPQCFVSIVQYARDHSYSERSKTTTSCEKSDLNRILNATYMLPTCVPKCYRLV